MTPLGNILRRPWRALQTNWLREWSIRAAIREQGLWATVRYLEGVVPDIDDQYTSFKLNTPYERLKVRGLHAFQMGLVKDALLTFSTTWGPRSVVDLGDSAGTHTAYVLAYCKALGMDAPRCRSANSDSEAVKRINDRGMYARTADIVDGGIVWQDNLAMCFETLEHLKNPIKALRHMAYCKRLVLTVPWVRRSRVATVGTWPEGSHVFELSPEDWGRVLERAGWQILRSRIYRQYPRWHPWGWLLRRWWRAWDYEGFWGAVVKPIQLESGK